MLHESRQRGCLAELLVAYRFMEAKRISSWPLVPCAYDLVVDGGEKLYRVQVRQAHLLSGSLTKWRVRLTKRHPKRDKPKAVADIDLICVVCTPERVFVIPVEACVSPVDPRYLNAQIEIGPESRYQVFLNRFSIGTGESTEVTCTPVPALRTRGWGKGQSGGLVPGRKPHRRLTMEQVQHLLTLPIRWHSGLVGMNPTDVAHQFDVSVVTLRNLLLRKSRKDLRGS